jgi:hypothetical protein
MSKKAPERNALHARILMQILNCRERIITYYRKGVKDD